MEGKEKKNRRTEENKVITREGANKERTVDMEIVVINEEDVGRAINNLKKAPDIDGIPMKARRYKGTAIRKGLTELIRKIWNGGNIPEDWKTSVILPLYKKRDQEKTENYRGISLLCSAYKIYAKIVKKSWRKKQNSWE